MLPQSRLSRGSRYQAWSRRSAPSALFLRGAGRHHDAAGPGLCERRDEAGAAIRSVASPGTWRVGSDRYASSTSVSGVRVVGRDLRPLDGDAPIKPFWSKRKATASLASVVCTVAATPRSIGSEGPSVAPIEIAPRILIHEKDRQAEILHAGLEAKRGGGDRIATSCPSADAERR
jgi:hypothetical protein